MCATAFFVRGEARHLLLSPCNTLAYQILCGHRPSASSVGTSGCVLLPVKRVRRCHGAVKFKLAECSHSEASSARGRRRRESHPQAQAYQRLLPCAYCIHSQPHVQAGRDATVRIMVPLGSRGAERACPVLAAVTCRYLRALCVVTKERKGEATARRNESARIHKKSMQPAIAAACHHCSHIHTASVHN